MRRRGSRGRRREGRRRRGVSPPRPRERRRRPDLGREARRAPGARVRPRARGQRRRGLPRDARLRRRTASTSRCSHGRSSPMRSSTSGEAARPRPASWGVDPARTSRARSTFVESHRSPVVPRGGRRRSSPRTAPGPPTSTTSSTWCARRSTGSRPTRSDPSPSTCTGPTPTSPRRSSSGLAEIGGFGLSVPEEYGGLRGRRRADYLGMVVATEELSWGSLGVGGSLITRPEILTRAIVQGGTEEQKHGWLPRIASGELMVGVMVTEPDFGSDVARLKVTATPSRRRVPHQRREDVGDVRRARRHASCSSRAPTPTATLGHRGLSMFVVDKEPAPGHSLRVRPRTAAAQWRDGRSTRSGTAACTRTRCRSPTGSCRRRTSSARPAGSARASTSRWRASRTAGSRPRRGPSASCRRRSTPGSRTRRSATSSARQVFDYQLSQAKLARMAALDPGGPAVLLRRRTHAWAAARARSRRRWSRRTCAGPPSG